MIVRPAGPADLEPLAALWFQGWQDAHAAIAAPEVKADRTLASFRRRLTEATGELRTAGPPGAPVALAYLRGDEVYQFYVAAAARGTGLATTMLKDAETRIAGAGYATAWLDCVIGNDRAARFYEKSGWRRTGIVTTELDLSGRPFLLDIWRYETSVR
jgi:GNAT superfamily N-acetyltransferase